MVKRMIIMLVLVGVFLGGLLSFEAFLRPGIIRTAIAKSGNQTQTVSAIHAEAMDWQPSLAALGTLRAAKGADLSAEVAGVVAQIDFDSGNEAAEGAVLVRLRDEDDAARLRSLEAMAELARITDERDRKQLKAQAVSQATIDSDEANLRNARAEVEQQRATLDKKTIRAPFAGRLGIREVDVGQYLAAGTPIVTLQALDPIYVDFTLPQQTLEQIKIGQAVELAIDAYPGRAFPGAISSVSSKVDPATRNVQVRASLANADRKLLPGMYATVTISTGMLERHITLPQTAIAYNSYGSTVYLVDEQAKNADGAVASVARQIFVTLGATRGDQVAVLSGVKEGDTVVTAGQIKLRNGAQVVIDNTIQPPNEPNPRPVER